MFCLASHLSANQHDRSSAHEGEDGHFEAGDGTALKPAHRHPDHRLDYGDDEAYREDDVAVPPILSAIRVIL